MRSLVVIFAIFLTPVVAAQDAATILQRIDANLSSRNRVFESDMTIHSRRGSRTISSRSYAEGNQKSFTEYLAPASDKGTKMLKLDKQLWIFDPGTDRTIQLSGHMLRQSVMGSDLSYEDMMDDRSLSEMYTAVISGRGEINGQAVVILELTAKAADLAYHSQKLWVDAVRYVPLKQELYAKSGKLLKKLEMSNITQIQGRWFPMTMLYKDMLKQGDGTEFNIRSIQFDAAIPNHIFTKASLRK
ncbi:MAG: outer membrane lipoprotein-sorting protein [Lentimicrobiaceae bacterium]|nr:outer membrane lipoprotein-sorting protein [Lentimicrobiaceae bacterium]